ncbi:MAG: hypothetical protein ACI8XO_000971, partial [Verrucomicrobiales bacterium]
TVTFASGFGGGTPGVNPLPPNEHSILRLNNIPVTGLANLQVHVYLATTDTTNYSHLSTIPSTPEPDDHIQIQYAIDGSIPSPSNTFASLSSSNYSNVGQFLSDSDPALDPLLNKGPMKLDRDLDGVVFNDLDDLPVATLNGAMTEYTFNIPVTGDTLSVQIKISNGETADGQEELAFDHLRVSGENAVTNPPALAGIEVADIMYTEGDGAVQITNTITVADNDSTDLNGATVSIASGFDLEDQLNFTDMLGITGSFAGNMLTLTGTSSLANYQTALRSVQYENTDNINPSTATRTINFQGTDGANNSNITSRNIQITTVIAAGTIPHLENLDTDGEGERYTSSRFNGASESHFERTDSNPHPDHNTGSGLTFVSPQTAGYWSSDDITSVANPLSDHGILRLQNLNSTGLTNLQVHLYLAERAPNNSDLGDKIEIQYAVDGNTGGTDLTSGNYTTIGRFVPDAMGIGTGPMKLDRDLDGATFGDGDDAPVATLGTTMTRYTFDVPVTGSTLSVQIRIQQDFVDEELAFDHIEVTGILSGPEIDVQGNGMSIAGDNTNVPATSDDTSFGSVECGIDADVVHTFTILSTGTELTLDGSPFVQLSGSPDFAVTAQPTSPVAATTGSTTFNVTFSPSSAGAKTAVVSIDNDDADEDPYTFNIAGTGIDTTPPVITLTALTGNIECNVDTYSEPGFSATDACDGNVTGSVVVVGTVDESTPGTYNVTYNVMDAAGNAAIQITRVVTVEDTLDPEISGAKDIIVSVPAGSMTDPITYNLTATDICDPSVTVVCVPPSGSTFGIGVNPVNCTATDDEGNVGTASFNVIVLEIAITPGSRLLDAIVVRGETPIGSPGAILNINRAFLNNAGQVLFSSSLSGAGTSNYGIFSGPVAGPHTTVAIKETASGVGNYGNFSDLTLNDSGDTGFASLISGTSNLGHFANGINSAVKGGLAPTGGGETYRSLQKPALAANGNLLTRANLNIGSGAPAVTSGDDTLITSSAGTVIAREGDTTSIGGGVLYSGLQNRIVASEGNNRYAFSANLKPGSSLTNSGLFVGILGAPNPSLVTREGETAQDVVGGVFATFLSESVNSAGAVVLRANVRGSGITSTNNEGLWTNSGNTGAPPRLIAREGNVAPCLSTNLVAFSRFTTLAIADDGSVCFFAYLTNAGATPAVNSTNDGSIWRWTPTGLHLIAREGDQANNTDGAGIGRLTTFACSGTGGVVYQVEYVANQGDFTSANRDGIYLDRGLIDAAPELILRRGDAFDFMGSSHTVSSLTIGTEENAASGTGGYGRAINDMGSVLLNLSLTGNVSGIFVLTP